MPNTTSLSSGQKALMRDWRGLMVVVTSLWINSCSINWFQHRSRPEASNYSFQMNRLSNHSLGVPPPPHWSIYRQISLSATSKGLASSSWTRHSFYLPTWLPRTDKKLQAADAYHLLLSHVENPEGGYRFRNELHAHEPSFPLSTTI